MSCAVFTMLGLIVLIFKKSNEWTIGASFILACLFLIVAIALAWKDEHQKLEDEIAKNIKPIFTADITETVRDVSLDKEAYGRSLIANISIVNRSYAPSTIRSIYVTMPDHDGKFPASEYGSARIHTGKASPCPPGLGVIESTVPLDRTVLDALPRITATTLDKGIHIGGWVKFADVPYAYKGIRPQFYLVDGYGDIHGPFSPNDEFHGGLIQ